MLFCAAAGAAATPALPSQRTRVCGVRLLHRNADARLRKPASSTVCRADAEGQTSSRREIVLSSVNVGFLAAIFGFGAIPRPSNLGVIDYGGGVKSLSLCPASENCIATSEVANDPFHYAPPLAYNPEEGRGKKNPASQEQAMQELADVVQSIKPDDFTSTIITKTKDYLYAEFQSPTFGFIDDVEFWFPSDKPGLVEYRSASRVGDTDFNINRKRIKAIRQALEKKGWVSYGM